MLPVRYCASRDGCELRLQAACWLAVFITAPCGLHLSCCLSSHHCSSRAPSCSVAVRSSMQQADTYINLNTCHHRLHAPKTSCTDTHSCAVEGHFTFPLFVIHKKAVCHAILKKCPFIVPIFQAHFLDVAPAPPATGILAAWH